MKKTLQERLNLLQQAGIDTSKYELKLEGITLKSDDNVAISIVGNQQVNNKKLFRRWITAQTFKMLYSESYNYKTHCTEYGWDAYLRNNYDYMYQFKMLLEELRVLNKLELSDKEELFERAKFFNRKVVVGTCEHYMRQLHKYVDEHKDNKGSIKLAKYGTIEVNELRSVFTDKLYSIITEMECSYTYAELYTLLKLFIKHVNKLPYDTPKCPLWKDAFKGNGAYYTLKNLILFHGVLLRDCEDKKTSLDCLKIYTRPLKNGELWRLHMLLKDTIELNNFDLRKSIESNK